MVKRDQREHLVELVPRKDRTVAVYLNRRRVKVREITIHSDIHSRNTAVLMEVLQEPFVVQGGELKSWRWWLCPCRVVGELPSTLWGK